VPTLLIIAVAGCSQFRDPNVPDPIRPFTEPDSGGYYELYRPSYYDRAKSWPLIVVCHSSGFDSPNRQIRRWTQLAEVQGFIVVAPEIHSLPPALSFLRSRSFRATVAPENLRQDEKNILNIVRHVRGANNISQDRIFIHGYSHGAAAALYIGLRHGDLFRATAVSQPKLIPSNLAGAAMRIDKHQPVLVRYSISDAVTGKYARQCVDWLRSKGVKVTEDIGTIRHDVADRAVKFFEFVVATQPWVQVRSFSLNPDNPLETTFKARCSFTPSQYHWDFGDNQTSPVAEPVHVYAQPGRYNVTVRLAREKGKPVTRTVAVTVPAVGISQLLKTRN